MMLALTSGEAETGWRPGLPRGTTSLFPAAFALNTKAQIVDTIRACRQSPLARRQCGGSGCGGYKPEMLPLRLAPKFYSPALAYE